MKRYLPVGLLLLACGGQSNPEQMLPNAGGSTAGDAGHAGRAGNSGAGSPTGGINAGGSSSSGAGASGLGGEAGAPNDDCTASAVDGVTAYDGRGWDPLGYPPYALDGCTLSYVAAEGMGALRLRDLATGNDLLLEPAAASPRRPTLAGELLAWEVELDGKSQVRVRYHGETRTLSGPFDHAGEPRATHDAVVFTAFLGAAPNDDTDVYLYDAIGNAVVPVATGPGQQRFADVSASHVAVTDFSEDPKGYFDEFSSIADVLIVDRTSHESVVRKASGKQAFPLLGNSGTVAYLDWGAVHPEPKFSQFGLKSGKISLPVSMDSSLVDEDIHTDPAYVRPSLRGNYVDFVDTRSGQVGLYRTLVDGSSKPTQVPIAGSAQLLGPVAGDELTLVSRREGSGLRLVALSR
jgi:hypothetical protein